jgi:hypothetical protein
VLIGDSTIDLASYRALANMHFLGRKSYAELPAYCKEFDVGLIPFKINELTKAVNPIKLREYLAAGLPVVSTRLPEASLCGPWVRAAEGADDFVRAVQAELPGAVGGEPAPGEGVSVEACSPVTRVTAAARSAAVSSETWPAKLDGISQHLSRRHQD